jgi:hypothetical protein
MFLRRAAITMAAAAAIACSAGVSLVALSGTAGAATQFPNAIVTQGVVAAGTPYSSGQTVSVVVPTNSVLPAGVSVQIIECSAPNGVLPTLPSQCDTTTVQGDTVLTGTGGTVNYTNYQVYALPSPALGGVSPIVCGDTAATECVLFIGENYNDFTVPNVFSQPFKIHVNGGVENGNNPGDGTPEVPLAIGLPLAAAGIIGGGVLVRRRRSMKTHAA